MTPTNPSDLSAQGLSSAEAADRLRREGPNALPSGQRRTWITIVAETAREPMFLLLLAAAALYLVLGELHEGLVLLGLVLVTLGLTLYQEGKTERAIEALRDLTSPRALVIRDGQRRRIAGREVVRGEPAPARPGGDGTPYLYSGTLVVAGQGVARVSATGANTEIGCIGAALGTLGATSALCVDKTGTLTENRMTMVRLWAGGQTFAVEDATAAGLPRHRRRARGGRLGLARRQLRLHRERGAAGAAHFRQYAKVHVLHPGGARADRRHGAAAGAVGPAGLAVSHAHRVSRTHHRPVVLAGVRERAGGSGRHAAAAFGLGLASVVWLGLLPRWRRRSTA